MTEKFLYEGLDALSEYGKGLNKEIPSFLKDNLNPKFKLRLSRRGFFPFLSLL